MKLVPSIMLISGCVTFWQGVIQPIFVWLRTSYYPRRDVFYLLDESGPLRFTDWAGVNEILNGVMGMNMFFVWMMLLFFVMQFYD